jgi:hypothetical protein
VVLERAWLNLMQILMIKLIICNKKTTKGKKNELNMKVFYEQKVIKVYKKGG